MTTETITCRGTIHVYVRLPEMPTDYKNGMTVYSPVCPFCGDKNRLIKNYLSSEIINGCDHYYMCRRIGTVEYMVFEGQAADLLAEILCANVEWCREDDCYVMSCPHCGHQHQSHEFEWGRIFQCDCCEKPFKVTSI